MIGLRVMNKPQKIFLAHLFASISTIVISIPLVKFLGIVGAVIGLILSVSVVFATVRYHFAKAIKVGK